MLFYTGLIFLVIAVSLDGFGVGITYGMRKIHVPFLGLGIIMFCSGFIVFLSMTIGHFLLNIISPDHAAIIGGCILIFIGSFALTNILRAGVIDKRPLEKPTQQLSFGTTFKTILMKPERADIDHSGVISTHEALFLGVALALDAFGAGIGASMLGYSPFLTTVLIASMSGIFVYSGIQIGLILAKNKYLQQMTFIPPLLLIILGVLNILLN